MSNCFLFKYQKCFQSCIVNSLTTNLFIKIKFNDILLLYIVINLFNPRSINLLLILYLILFRIKCKHLSFLSLFSQTNDLIALLFNTNHLNLLWANLRTMVKIVFVLPSENDHLQQIVFTYTWIGLSVRTISKGK